MNAETQIKPDVRSEVTGMLHQVNRLLRTELPDPMYRTQLNAVRMHLEAALGV